MALEKSSKTQMMGNPCPRNNGISGMLCSLGEKAFFFMKYTVARCKWLLLGKF
jgi:hypothetical protein